MKENGCFRVQKNEGNSREEGEPWNENNKKIQKRKKVTKGERDMGVERQRKQDSEEWRQDIKESGGGCFSLVKKHKKIFFVCDNICCGGLSE